MEGAVMPRRLLQYALLAVLVATAVTVPAGAANREHQQMMADIRMLQEQVQQQQLQIAGLSDTLKTIIGKLDDQSGATRKAFADQKLLADNISADVRVVREKVDDNNLRIGSLGQEVEALRLAIPTTPPQPAVTPGEEPPGAQVPVAGQPPPAPAPAAGQLPPSPQRLFESAWSDYTAGVWGLAVEGFDQYVRTYPKSDRAGEAQYYIGKAQLQDGKFEEAVTAFNKVIADYPEDRIVPSAYFNRGVALESLGRIDQARETYDYIVKTYPADNSAVTLAKQRLERLAAKK
jgi:tol-pal system protein YbgF